MTTEMTTYQRRKSEVDTALDVCGIGHNLCDRFNAGTAKAEKFCADVMGSIQRQLLYNLVRNEPCGVMRGIDSGDGHADHAIQSGAVHAIGCFVEWDVNRAIEFAAAILEDVNAHPEAKALRDMVITEG